MNRRQFNTRPLNRFASTSTTISRPTEITCFSRDDQRRVHRASDPTSDAACSLRYYYPPTRLPEDLNRGFETFRRRDEADDSRLDSLLDAVVDVEKERLNGGPDGDGGGGVKLDADFITWRGMMTKILTAPFSLYDGFEMDATLFEGTIFIQEHEAYRNRQKEIQRSRPTRPGFPSQLQMEYWGYKFETISLLPDASYETDRDFIDARRDHVVDNNAEYCSVVQTAIGGSKLVMGGEVDAIRDRSKPADKTAPINWVELKTSALIRDQRDDVRFERKLLKFWAQSFLLGVPQIVVGFRDEQGILRAFQDIATLQIPAIVNSRKQTWDGNVCTSFAAEFLAFLKQTINSEGVWQIRKAEKSPVIEVFKLEEAGHGGILSPEFLKWRAELANSERSRGDDTGPHHHHHQG